MANTTIAIKKSATVSSIPSTLEFGELAINYADGKLYYKNVNSSIVEFAPSGGGEGNSFGTVNANSTLIVADTPGDILTLVAGIGIAIEGDAVTDTITISATSTVTTVEVAAAFDKANSANVLAFNTGIGANAFTSATIAGANAAVGAGANTVGTAAFVRANTAETTAIAAFDKANTSGGGIDISTDNTTDGTFYVTLSSLTTGTATTLNVATTKLTFNPSTGTLSATIFNSLSDREYKANIKTLINSLDVVDNLRGVSFNWKDNGQASIGVIAQEIETYVPALVTDNNGIKNVNYDGIIGLLIESIKELKSRIEVLENKNG
jgi:hypothetical protein